MTPHEIPSLPLATNGTGPHVETCIERILRLTRTQDAAHWRLVFRYCHIPADAPAHEWEAGIDRVHISGSHLQLPAKE